MPGTSRPSAAPPPTWVRLASLVLPAAYRDEIVDDLVEERGVLRRSGRSATYAAAWLAWHLLLSAVASRRRSRASDPAGAGHPPRGLRMLTGPGLGPEFRQAARSLQRTPWYSGTVIPVVALSITLATTAFAIVDGVLFRPLPYPDPDQLYVVGGVFSDGATTSDRGVESLSPKEITAWRAEAPDVVMTGLLYMNHQLPDGTSVPGAGIDNRFFDVFGVRLQLGRFGDEHARPIPWADPRTLPPLPAVISHRVWVEHFEGDPDVLGRLVQPPSRSAVPYRIVGVLEPDGFVPPMPQGITDRLNYPRRIDILTPWTMTPDQTERGLFAYARIEKGALPGVRGMLDRAATAYATTVPPPPATASAGRRRALTAYTSVDVLPLAPYLTRRERPLFAIVFVSAMALVLIVLLNAGALAAARAAQRMRETTLRRALGARTRDLLRHAFVEQVVLAIPGTALGLALSPVLLRVTAELLPPGIILIKEARVDWRVAVFAALAMLTTSFLVALFPLGSARRNARLGQPHSGAVERATRRRATGRSLVAIQVALAFVMLIGGLFFTTSLARVWSEEPGFRTRDAALIRVQSSQSIPRRQAADLAASLRGVPGIEHAAISEYTYSLNRSYPRSRFRRPETEDAPGDGPAAYQVAPGFFDAAEIELRSGRFPSAAELETAAPVLAVSEEAARLFWPDEPALGQTLLNWRGEPFTVVGVVADARWQAPDIEAIGAIYEPWLDPEGLRTTSRFEIIVALETGTTSGLTSALARVHDADPGFAVTVETVEDALVDSIRARRLSTLTASVFGVVALVIVSVGLLGLVAMTASRRTKEVGIRMALGARRSGVVRQLLGEQLIAVTIGIVAGGLVAVWAVGLIQAQLYETAPGDPVVWLTAVATMLAAATVGALVPALRASHVDPVRALREE